MTIDIQVASRRTEKFSRRANGGRAAARRGGRDATRRVISRAKSDKTARFNTRTGITLPSVLSRWVSIRVKWTSHLYSQMNFSLVHVKVSHRIKHIILYFSKQTKKFICIVKSADIPRLYAVMCSMVLVLPGMIALLLFNSERWNPFYNAIFESNLRFY